jgi:hypothetical protein
LNKYSFEPFLSDAYIIFQQLAQSGTSQNKFQFAQSILAGKFSDKNLEEAQFYFRLNAIEGNPSYKLQYAQAILNKSFLENDFQEAEEFARLAASEGKENEKIIYVQMILDKKFGEIDYTKARDFLRISADSGNIFSKMNYVLAISRKAFGRVDFSEIDYEEAKFYMQGLNQVRSNFSSKILRNYSQVFISGFPEKPNLILSFQISPDWFRSNIIFHIPSIIDIFQKDYKIDDINHILHEFESAANLDSYPSYWFPDALILDYFGSDNVYKGISLYEKLFFQPRY